LTKANKKRNTAKFPGRMLAVAETRWPDDSLLQGSEKDLYGSTGFPQAVQGKQGENKGES
jgi:hypothetical protein